MPLRSVSFFILISVLFSLSHAQTDSPSCPVSGTCPQSKEQFELSYSPSAVDSPLAEMSQCAGRVGRGAMKNLEKKKDCLTSLFECTQTLAKSAAQGIAFVSRVTAPTSVCLFSRTACYSQAADSLRSVGDVLDGIKDTRNSLPPSRRRALTCAMAGVMGPDLALSAIGGMAAAKYGEAFLAFLGRVKKLKNLFASEQISEESFEALLKLDDKNLKKALRAHDQNGDSAIDRAARVCMLRTAK